MAQCFGVSWPRHLHWQSPEQSNDCFTRRPCSLQLPSAVTLCHAKKNGSLLSDTSCRDPSRRVQRQITKRSISLSICRHMYICICVSMYIYIHIYIYICTYLYIHILLSLSHSPLCRGERERERDMYVCMYTSRVCFRHFAVSFFFPNFSLTLNPKP